MNTAALAFALALAADQGAPVVVMPPDGPRGVATGWLGMVVAEMLPRALQRAGVPAVPAADRRRAQETLGVPGAAISRATSIRVAEALGASRLVVGSWELDGSELQLSLRLLDAGRGSLSAPLAGSAPLVELAGLVHSLAWDVALAGPSPPSGTREAFLRSGAAASFESLRALGEALAVSDSARQLSAARRAAALDPGCEEAALVLARLLVDARGFEEARRVIAKLQERSVFAGEARFLDGVALLGLGRYREADTLYARLAADERSPAALSNRAVARLRSGAGVKGASTLLRQAVELEPASLDLPFNLGWALLVEGDAPAAAFWLQAALRRDPADAQGRLLLSWALAAGSRAAEAEEQWKAAVALTPAFEGLRKAELSRRFERVFGSAQALLVDPERRSDAGEARARVARGEALLEANDLAGAVSELARATLLDPYAAAAHRLLARARRAQGDGAGAVEELQMALWCREDPHVRRDLAELLRALGRPEEAKRILE